MVNFSSINTEKSIAKGKLFSNRSKLEKIEQIIDIIVWITLCIAAIAYSVIACFHINNSNDKVVAFALFPLIILCALYGLYRKLTENKLLSINTLLPKQKNKEQLLEFLKLNGYELYGETKEVLIVHVQQTLSFNNLRIKIITFIIDDSKIYFTMVNNYPKINPPVFFAHRSLKAHLNKFFRNK